MLYTIELSSLDGYILIDPVCLPLTLTELAVISPSTSPPTSMLLASILPPTLPLTLTLLPCTVRAFPSMSHVLQLSSFTLPVKLKSDQILVT